MLKIIHRFYSQGDGMLGLYTVVALRELGYETVYCSGNRIRRAEHLKCFGAIPIYNGRKEKYIYIYKRMKINFILLFQKNEV